MSHEHTILMPEKITGLYPSSISNVVARVFTFSSYLMEPLYSIFIWQSMQDAVAEALRIFGVAVSDQIRSYIQIVGVPFVVASFMCDLATIDAFREADKSTAPNQTQPTKKELTKKILGIFIQWLAFFTSYPAGASANVMPIAEFVAPYFSGTSAQDINYSSLALILTLGVIYYMMFTNERIQKHADVCVDILRDPIKFFQNMIKYLGIYLEIAIQVLGNSSCRGIGFAYTWGEALNKVFNLPKEVGFNKTSSMITGASTFFVTLFSRTLSTRDQLLNEEFENLTVPDFHQAPKFWSAYLFDLLLSIIRGTSLGYIINEQLTPFHPSFLGHEPTRIIRVIGCTLLGIGMFAHSAKIRYDAGRKQRALALKKSQENINNNLRSIETDPIKKAIQQFDEIAASYDSPGFNFAIDTINTMARLAKFVAFLIFVKTINQVFLNNLFSDNSVVAFTFLWGLEVFKNNGDVYRESIKKTCQGQATKWALQHPNHWTFTRGLKTFFSSPYSYSGEKINQLHSQICKVEKVTDSTVTFITPGLN